MAILMLAVACALNHFSVPSWGPTCVDTATSFAGSLSGLMNTFGGALLAPIMTAYIASHFGWTWALDFAAMLTAVGALLRIFANAGENLETNIAIRAAGRRL